MPPEDPSPEETQQQKEDPPSSDAGVKEDPPAQKSEDAEFWRKKFERAETSRKSIERAQMSELDRTKAELADIKAQKDGLEAKLKEGDLRSAFVAKAKAAGIHDPDAAFVLSDRSKMAMSDDGKLVGADTAILQLKKDKPYLFEGGGRLGSGGGKGGKDAAQTLKDKMNDDIRRKAFGG